MNFMTGLKYSNSWPWSQNSRETWNISQRDKEHRAPWLKPLNLLVRRDGYNTSALLDSVSAASTVDIAQRTRLLAGILGCVGGIVLITFFCLLFWRRRILLDDKDVGQINVHVERSYSMDHEPNPKSRMSSLRPMFLPLQLGSISARWSVRRDSMVLPIHAPPRSLLQSQSEPRIVPRIRTPTPPQMAYIPIAPPRVVGNRFPPPEIPQIHSHRTHTVQKDQKVVGTIIINPPRIRSQVDPRSPPPTYAQSTSPFFLYQASSGPRKESLPDYQ